MIELGRYGEPACAGDSHYWSFSGPGLVRCRCGAESAVATFEDGTWCLAWVVDDGGDETGLEEE